MISKVIEILPYFFIKNDMLSDLNMFHGKMSDFVSVPLFRVTLVIKLTNFDFVGHWNTIIFFDKKMMLDLIISCQTVSVLLNLRCLSIILTIR